MLRPLIVYGFGPPSTDPYRFWDPSGVAFIFMIQIMLPPQITSLTGRGQNPMGDQSHEQWGGATYHLSYPDDAGHAQWVPQFFGTAIQCEIARRFPRSVVKVGPDVQCKISVFSVGLNLEPRRIWNYHILIHNMWTIQILKRGIGKTRCKPMRNLAKIQISPKHVLPQTCQPLRSQKSILQPRKAYFSYKKRILQCPWNLQKIVKVQKIHIVKTLS